MRKKQTGFTLIELMVATAIMSVLAGMSWVGIDALFKTKERTSHKATENAQRQITLGQWSSDLDQAFVSKGLQPMGWDGKAFRITRRAETAELGLQVIAWAVRSDGQRQQLMRWKSAPFTDLRQWQQAWQEAAVWARGGANGKQVVLLPAMSMDVHIWSNNAWTNSQSSTTALTESGPESASAVLARSRNAVQPQGVRMMLRTEQGVLTKDWANPTYSEAKS